MAKRFTDTTKYKKAFFRRLPGAYKLLWDYLYHDCDHAGIWIVDFGIAQTYVGEDMFIEKGEALLLFNQDEIRIIEFDNNKKWFIPSFITFQYGALSEKNRAHKSAIDTLKKFNLLNADLSPIEMLPKPLLAIAKGDKDKAKDMDKDKDKETEIYGSAKNACYNIETYLLTHEKTFNDICMAYPRYTVDEIRHTVTAYHLECETQDWYPRKPIQLIAGVKKWLHNKPNFSKNGRDNATSVGKTFKPD